MQRNSPIRKALRSLCTPCDRDKRTSLADHSRKYSIERRQEGAAKINDATNSFFNYTSGRWLYNKHLRLSKRRLHFSINELCHLVAKSVGLPRTDIVLVTKIAEGGLYRIFEATFRDGLKVIARLPYPYTIPRKYGVASEVATMKFFGINIHGLVLNEEFESARERARLIKNELAEGADTEERREFDELWPFQDHEEID